MSIANLIYDISLNQITQYLLLNGWDINEEYKNKKLKLFYKDDLVIMLPLNEKFKDYNIRLREAIELLSDINVQNIEEVIEDIKSIAVDKMSFRIIGDISKDGKIPLSYASTFIDAIKYLVMSAGCGEEDPKPFFKKLPRGSRQFSENFQFGQTQMGSFVFNVETRDFGKDRAQIKLDDNGTERDEVPIERRIIKRVVKGLKQIEKDSFANLEQIFDNGYLDGINANMCDAILQFKSISEDIEIESIIRPSKIFKEDEIKEEKILIDKLSFNTAEIISKTYKEEKSFMKISVIATVKNVTIDKIEDGAGNVVVKFNVSNKDRHAKLYLDGKRYKDACEALKNKSTKVSLKGLLNTTNLKWEFDTVEKFEILE